MVLGIRGGPQLVTGFVPLVEGRPSSDIARNLLASIIAVSPNYNSIRVNGQNLTVYGPPLMELRILFFVP